MNLANHIQNKSYYFVSNGKTLLLYKTTDIAWTSLWREDVTPENIVLGFESYYEALDLSKGFESEMIVVELRDLGDKITIREVKE